MRILDRIDDILWGKKAQKLGNHIYYISKIGNDKPWAFVCYIPEACYRHSLQYLNGHQSRREMKVMVKVFNELGYNVYVGRFTDTDLPKDITPTVILGLEPAFEAACKKWPNALKIYYATGASFTHAIKMIKLRTDEVNKLNNPIPPLEYKRLPTESDRYELANWIIQIGSHYTVETYPEQFRSKIKLTRQSSTMVGHFFRHLNLSKKDRHVFLCIVGGGPILKGVDLVLEYFRLHPELKLHLVGPIDDVFFKAVGGYTSNVVFHGFINTGSKKFKTIAEESMFVINPSCTEGGIPGTVINSMYYGCIPIVSRWASFDGIKDYGFMINDLSVDGISKAVDKSMKLSNQQLIELSKKGYEFIKGNYNLKTFKFDLTNTLRTIL